MGWEPTASSLLPGVKRKRRDMAEDIDINCDGGESRWALNAPFPGAQGLLLLPDWSRVREGLEGVGAGVRSLQDWFRGA